MSFSPPGPGELTALLMLLALAAVATRLAYRRGEAAGSQAERLQAEAQRREAERLREVSEEALRVTRTQAAQLKDLGEAKSRFFANISHEFRTPLTLTLGPLEDVADGLHGALPPQARVEIEQAIRNARRLLNLVNQMLELSRLEAGERKLSAREGNLADGVLPIAGTFESLARRRQIRYLVRPPDGSLRLWFDPELIEIVMLNLLGNAFKFTPDGGSIQVVIDSDSGAAGTTARISVRDSGPGIPREEQERVFDRFHRGKAALDESAGTGIGLSLVREIVQLHGGTITIESEPGFGAEFRVRLPLGSGHLSREQMVTPPIADAPPSRGRLRSEGPPVDEAPDTTGEEAVDEEDAADIGEADRTVILVVDDNAEIRAFLRKHLKEDYRVVEAADGEEGLEMARREVPDLVLSDVMMPRMDGYAFCRALKADPETSFVPLILLTARGSEESRIHGLELGADDFLTKPFNRRELLVRVRNLIDSRKRLRGALPAAGWASPLSPDVPSADQELLARIRSVIESRMEDEDFSVHTLAREVGLDRSQLFRRLRALSNVAPSELIRLIRLERGAQLLQRGAGSVSEIAYSVGFKSVSHFSASFRDKYGCTPSTYGARVKD